LAWSIGLTAILAAILSAAIVWLVEREHAGEEWVRHSRAVHSQIAQLLIVVQRMESSQRGYLLTGRDLYLSSYNDAETELRALIDEAARLVADDTHQQQETFAKLRQVAFEKMRELRATVREQEAGRTDGALAIVKSDRGLRLMDQLRQLFAEMKNEEDRVLSNRLSSLERVGTLLQVGAAIPFVLIGAIGVLTRLYIRRSLLELTAALRQRAQNQVHLQLAMDAAHLGSWQYDPLHGVVSGDMRFKEIVDIAENEPPIEAIIERVNPDDAERVRAALQPALDPGEPTRSTTEFRLRRGDGEVRWIEALGLTQFEGVAGERGATGVVGTVADITERKHHEEREHLLMREMNHRAKNMLGLVQAIARQTATRNPEDFIERFSERIQSLSANQELLVRNEWKGVEIGNLVRAQLAHFADLIGSRIALQGPMLRLKAACAQAIGLALHELATNAGKYGALSTETGRVDICWKTEGDTFTMSWVERDGPPVSAPKRRGFGTVVMEAMTERSVDGTVDLDYSFSGLSWRLTCPAANAVGSNGSAGA
jgi:two-component sensor histidine kinase/CHASE3 domain sensor protein